MHEMSMIEGLLKVVHDQLDRYPSATVQSLQLQVGQLRQLEPEMLEFCYDAVVIGTRLDGSKLVIKRIEAVAHCDACKIDFPVEQSWFECPKCHVASPRLVSGNELDLIGIELDTSQCDKMSVAAVTSDSLS